MARTNTLSYRSMGHTATVQHMVLPIRPVHVGTSTATDRICSSSGSVTEVPHLGGAAAAQQRSAAAVAGTDSSTACAAQQVGPDLLDHGISVGHCIKGSRGQLGTVLCDDLSVSAQQGRDYLRCGQRREGCVTSCQLGNLVGCLCKGSWGQAWAVLGGVLLGAMPADSMPRHLFSAWVAVGGCAVQEVCTVCGEPPPLCCYCRLGDVSPVELQAGPGRGR